LGSVYLSDQKLPWVDLGWDEFNADEMIMALDLWR
jgi:hypothetical protein